MPKLATTSSVITGVIALYCTAFPSKLLVDKALKDRPLLDKLLCYLASHVLERLSRVKQTSDPNLLHSYTI